MNTKEKNEKGENQGRYMQKDLVFALQNNNITEFLWMSFPIPVLMN